MSSGETGSTMFPPTPQERSAVEVGHFGRYAAAIWVIAFTIESLLIITSNILSIVVFTSKKYRMKKSSILMTNLAVADLLVGLLGTGFQIYTVGTPSLWQFHFHFHINVLFDIFTGFASLFSLTAIALERMYATVFPVHYKFNSPSKYVIVVAMVWILASSLPCLSFFLPHRFLSTTNIIMASLLCLTVVTIILCYTLIGVKLTRQEDRCQRQIKIVKTLFLVTFLSLVSWLPFQVIILVKYMSSNRYQINSLYVVVSTKFLQYGNSFVNTIVYYFRMPGFRKDLKNILAFKFQCCLREQVRNDAQVAERQRQHDNSKSRNFPSVDTQTDFTDETKL